jgi:hypothetical protein
MDRAACTFGRVALQTDGHPHAPFHRWPWALASPHRALGAETTSLRRKTHCDTHTHTQTAHIYTLHSARTFFSL